MDAKKIIGVTLVVAVIVVFGFVLVQQMSDMSPSPNPGQPLTVVPQNGQPVRPGLSEDAQDAPLPDTRKPATIDAIVLDISGEAEIDNSVLANEISGESSIIEDEGSSLNEVSQFYDENSL